MRCRIWPFLKGQGQIDLHYSFSRLSRPQIEKLLWRILPWNQISLITLSSHIVQHMKKRVSRLMCLCHVIYGWTKLTMIFLQKKSPPVSSASSPGTGGATDPQYVPVDIFRTEDFFRPADSDIPCVAASQQCAGPSNDTVELCRAAGGDSNVSDSRCPGEVLEPWCISWSFSAGTQEVLEWWYVSWFSAGTQDVPRRF